MTEPAPQIISVPPSEPVTLRPARSEDEPFLFTLFASTREEEFAPLGWDGTTKDQFLRSQFDARKQGYADMFPDAVTELFIQQQGPVGGWILSSSPGEVHLVDFALLPAYRGRGIGTSLLKMLQGRAGSLGQSLRLEVLPWERATRLYQRLGFQKTEQAGMHEIMRWPHPSL